MVLGLLHEQGGSSSCVILVIVNNKHRLKKMKIYCIYCMCPIKVWRRIFGYVEMKD